MTTLIESPTNEAAPMANEEQRILLEGISWDRFEQLWTCFQDTHSVRLTYLDGRLEILSPVGPEHERRKKIISYLLETYLDLKGIRYYGRGGFTLKMPERAAGEPDESYCIGSDKPLPDLVVEVVVTSDALSKLPLYQVLGIPEAWIWREDELEIQCLDEGAYRRSPTSRWLPDLDSPLLAAHARMPDQYDAVRAFRRAIV